MDYVPTSSREREATDEIRESLMGMFKSQLELDMDTIARWQASGDWSMIGDRCHCMQGSAGIFGFIDLSKALRDVELGANATDGSSSMFQLVDTLLMAIRSTLDSIASRSTH